MILPSKSIIASGPVIIENNKVLLNKDADDYFWKFCGGEVEDFSISLEENAKREAREEMGIEIEIIKPLKTIILNQLEKERVVILIHYLANRIGEIKPDGDTTEWNWFDIHNLPEDVAPNVKEIINDYLKIK